VKKFFDIRNSKSGVIENREGEMIYEQEYIAGRWKKHCMMGNN